MVELVSARTPLRRVGARWTGRCPFHEERTPSFSVNPAEKLFYCFGCGKGGDLIAFVRETEALDFAGAVEWLADRYGFQLEYEESSPEAEAGRRRRERLLALLEAAAAFYGRHLWDSEEGAFAREYLAGRGLGEEVCREFRLGLAPGGTTLTRKAMERGFTKAELVAAGLTTQRGTDYFARRLLFPLTDARGRVLGFQARKLYDDDPLRGKYVNTAEGELFRKGNLLYGLHLARGAIAKQDRAVVVEGNTDVIALRQAGFEPVVAAMGTALTEGQLTELGRLARSVVLCFDGDAAGEAAALRGMELAVAKALDVRVVPLPAGRDPADLADRFEDYVAEAESYALYRVGVELKQNADPEVAYERVRVFLDRLPDSPQRHDAWRLANDRLGMTVQLKAAVRTTTARSSPVSEKVLSAGHRLERDALAGVVAHPHLVAALGDLAPDHFDDDLHRRVRAHLVERGEAEPDLVALLAELDARAGSEGIDDETAKELLLRLRERRLRRELQSAEPERAKELQAALTQIQEAVGGLT
jgi:DNA primase